MRLKKPTRAIIDQVRITREGNDATIDYADAGIAGPEFWGEVQPPASLKGLDIPSRRAVFVPWKPSRRPAFGMGNPTFR